MKENAARYETKQHGRWFSRSFCGTSREDKWVFLSQPRTHSLVCPDWLVREHSVQLASTVNNPVIVAGHEVVVYPLRLQQAGPAAVAQTSRPRYSACVRVSQVHLVLVCAGAEEAVYLAPRTYTILWL